MPQLPEQIRPYVAALAKYHFWILGLIVPLILVPLLAQGTGQLDTLIAGQQSQIKGQIDALTAITSRPDHPNESWSTELEKRTGEIHADTLAEWKTLYDEQEPLRVWPKQLGDDFITQVRKLKPGGSLNAQFLRRYRDTANALVRDLPQRMGAADLTEGDAVGRPGGGGFAEGAPPGLGGEFGGRPGFGGEFGGRPGPMAARPASPTGEVVEWAAEDQRRLLASFTWEKPPTTTQVLLAQEELWVYGLLCDSIKRVNAGATEPFNAPIMFVQELKVGYPAAEDQPGSQPGGRIVLPTATGQPGGEFGAEGMPPDAGMPGAEGAGRPAHPRFGGVAGVGGGGGQFGGEFGGEAAPDAAAAVSPDDQLREWIYVDFTGKPLTAAELATSPDAKLVHLVPFALRAVVDQRKVDALLTTLATNEVPIDVRQVRINPGVGGAAGGPGPGLGGAGGMAGGGGTRPNDVVLEIRGTVGLATQPNESVLLGTASAEGVPGA
jgi:hypothetical protein